MKKSMMAFISFLDMLVIFTSNFLSWSCINYHMMSNRDMLFMTRDNGKLTIKLR